MNATITAVRAQASDFAELCKPRIATLVLVTTFAGMWLAGNGTLILDLLVFTLLGTGLASAASGALNNYVDREVDKQMARTRMRALPCSRLHPQQALWLGVMLSLWSFAILFYLVNPLTAYLAAATTFFYVVIYTMWLKRSSHLCTEIGGVAGAAPPVIGWAAVTNDIGWPAVIMFIIMFIWQPPHFWALALLRADEYRQARLPMLPVTRGQLATKIRMLIYTVALLPVSTAMYWLDLVGTTYLVLAIALGVAYLVLTVDFARKPITHQSTRRLFGFSILYLLGLFTLIFADCRCSGGIIW
ncbi:MAG: heme o synthase [Gammaproteobacteria bacterium]|nr:heme o synthase [Gammaproteobacteria bacterium]